MKGEPVFRQILAHAENAHSNKPAIVADNRVLSYEELGSETRQRAAALVHRFSINPGDRVVLRAGSTAEFICTYLAVHSAGAVCVPLDPDTADDRLARIVERLAPRIVVSDVTLPFEVGTQVRYGELTAVSPSTSTDAASVSMSHSADVLFTTGTTAHSKGVVLCHRALATASAHINSFLGTRADAIEVLPLSLGHSFGLGRMRSVLSLGATLILVPGFTHPARIVNALSEHRATGFASVPAGIAILLSDADNALARFADQLEYLEIGSSFMPLQQKVRLMELLPKTRICMHYGLTEASRSAYISFHDDKSKLTSIGKPSPNVEMRIADRTGRLVDTGAEGEIEVRGGHLMTEYWQDPKLTTEALHDGWLRTGDLGRVDAEGYYWLEGRTDDVINVGGRKVLPQEIEEVLGRHPAIAECACAGIADPQGLSGEMISVWLVARNEDAALPGFPELAKLVRQQLEPWKMPRQFHWIDRIPKSSSGKVLRRQLRTLK